MDPLISFREETLERFRDHRERLCSRLAKLLPARPGTRFVEVPFPPGERDFVVFDTVLRVFTEARVKVLAREVKASEMHRVQPSWFETITVLIPTEVSDGRTTD